LATADGQRSTAQLIELQNLLSLPVKKTDNQKNKNPVGAYSYRIFDFS
jgi:hypothetical protein